MSKQYERKMIDVTDYCEVSTEPIRLRAFVSSVYEVVEGMLEHGVDESTVRVAVDYDGDLIFVGQRPETDAEYNLRVRYEHQQQEQQRVREQRVDERRLIQLQMDAAELGFTLTKKEG